MTETKFITKLLRLKGLKVVDLGFKGRSRRLTLTVKPYKNGLRCPECGRRCRIKNVLTDAREWRDIQVCQWTVYFIYCPKEIDCPTHGRLQEAIPWADAHARITKRLEYLVLLFAKKMSQKMAAELLRLSRSTFSRLLHRSIERHRAGHRIRGLTVIGIDEVSYLRRHKYITVVYDLERHQVVWVGKGKTRQTIESFFRTQLSEGQKERIQWACCDMSETFIGAIKAHCPNARLVLDRFHVQRALNVAVDEVRKQQWRLVAKQERLVLKGLRWVLFRHPERRSEDDRRALRALRKSNYRIYRACVLKDEFNTFWDLRNQDEARSFLNSWATTVRRGCLEPMKKFVETLERRMDSIISFVDCRLTNAASEGMNRIIGIIRNRASGFRNVEAFADLIYLSLGDVDILARIPDRFRTT